MGKFTVQKVKGGYKFNLKAGNGQIIATSSPFLTPALCMNAIEGVKRCAGSPVEDQTVSYGEKFNAPKYEIYHNAKDEKCFRLRDERGEILMCSEGYTAKRSCKTGISSVVTNAADAPVIGLDVLPEDNDD